MCPQITFSLSLSLSLSLSVCVCNICARTPAYVCVFFCATIQTTRTTKSIIRPTRRLSSANSRSLPGASE